MVNVYIVYSFGCLVLYILPRTFCVQDLISNDYFVDVFAGLLEWAGRPQCRFIYYNKDFQKCLLYFLNLGHFILLPTVSRNFSSLQSCWKFYCHSVNFIYCSKYMGILLLLDFSLEQINDWILSMFHSSSLKVVHTDGTIWCFESCMIML